MKGLLIKDLHLMKIEKRFFLVLIVMGVLIAFSTNDPSFMMGYITFVMPMFALSTIGYDEFDNGNAFLFTLPISRKGYVVEKYLFGLLLGAGALALTTALVLAFGAVNGMEAAWETLKGAPAILLAMVAVLSIMLPLQLKFGTEKSRIAILGAAGAAFLAGMGVVKLLEGQGVDVNALLAQVEQLPPIAFIMPVIVLLLVSLAVSVRIMNRKAF